MESEKVKDIKKAFECCKNSLCIDCPYYLSDCEMGLRYDMEDYINELESENAYQKEHIEMWFRKNEEKKKRIAELEGEITKLDIINSKLEMDIELLNKQNIDLEIDRDYYQEQFNEQEDFYVEWNKQQLEQFAERLKEEFIKSANIQDSITAKKLFRDICPVKVDKVLKKFIKEK